MDEAVNEEDYYRAQQLADLGSLRRDKISIVVDGDSGQQQRAQPKRLNDFGQNFQKSQISDSVRENLDKWSNLHSMVGDSGEELGSIMGGQSHRVQLNKNILYGLTRRQGPLPQQPRNSPPPQQHRKSTLDRSPMLGMPMPKMKYKPMYNGTSTSKPPPYHRPPQTARPSRAARPARQPLSQAERDSLATMASSAFKIPSTNKPVQVPKRSPNSSPSPMPRPPQAPQQTSAPKAQSAPKHQAAPKPQEAPKSETTPNPQHTPSKSRHKVELTGYNLPQPQLSAAFQPRREIRGDLLTFDSPPRSDSHPAFQYAMSDLMEIDDGEILTNKAIKHANGGLTASKYAASDDGSGIEQGRGKDRENSYEMSTCEVDFWQKALPRAVQPIIRKPEFSPKNGPPALSASRWAH